MQPQNLPPAPPPISPNGQPSGQYDFLFHEPPKKSKLPINLNSSNLKQRVLLVGGGAVVLLLLGMIVFGLLNSGSKGGQAEILKIAQTQAELVRVSEIGKTKARTTTAKNLAVITSLSITSDQASLVKTISPKPSSKVLALGKNKNTDDLLTLADQNNNFDAAFVTEIQKELKDYQVAVKKAYDQTSNKKTKAVLAEEYKNASVLAGVKAE